MGAGAALTILAAGRMPSWTSFAEKRILTVDDSRAVRAYLREILEEQGAAVVEARDGEEAIAACTGGERFDLVVLDLVLPDRDGIEVLEAIRAHDDEVPVVMLTGSGGIQSATEAVRKGADGYIEKQHLTGEEDESFLHALRQAVEHRSGHVAQKQLQEVKAHFYSMVTHDLRNPAGSVWGIVRLLRAGKAGPLSEQQERLLEIAETSAGRLVGLINDYLDFATIDAGYLRLEPAPAELRVLVEAAAREAMPQADLRRQRLVVDLPPEPLEGTVDARRLGQVLDNLLSNAVKYTPDGGRIDVSLARVDGDAVLRVSDSGMGIPPAQLPVLFERFHRVPGEATRGIRGTGLGLTIVKEIVAAHGGTVGAESAGVPGRGTTFTVRIPLGGAT